MRLEAVDVLAAKEVCQDLVLHLAGHPALVTALASFESGAGTPTDRFQPLGLEDTLAAL